MRNGDGQLAPPLQRTRLVSGPRRLEVAFSHPGLGDRAGDHPLPLQQPAEHQAPLALAAAACPDHAIGRANRPPPCAERCGQTPHDRPVEVAVAGLPHGILVPYSYEHKRQSTCRSWLSLRRATQAMWKPDPATRESLTGGNVLRASQVFFAALSSYIPSV